MLDIDGAWVGCNRPDRCRYSGKVTGRLIDLDLVLLSAGDSNALVTEKPGPWFLPTGTYAVTFISETPGETSFEELARCSTTLEATPNTGALSVSVLFRSTTCEIHVREVIVD